MVQGVPEDHLLPFMAMHCSTQFLQDGTPCHASKRIRDFLSTQSFQAILAWEFARLNPIDNAWNFMKRKLKSQDISSVPKLKEVVLKMWTQEMSQE
jgi:hypothetical protein